MVRKPGKKTAIKRDRRLSIYNPVDDEEDENLEIANLFDFYPDLMDEGEDESSF